MGFVHRRLATVLPLPPFPSLPHGRLSSGRPQLQQGLQALNLVSASRCTAARAGTTLLLPAL